MNEIFYQYFIEKGVSDIIAKRLVNKITKYEDIAGEFKRSISEKDYPQEKSIKIHGYTAADISRLAPHMGMGGVYNFLVLLRENPEEAEKIISENFPRK